MNRCPSTEQLSAFLDAEVSGSEARHLEAHLSFCPACRERLIGLERPVFALRGLPRAAPPADLAVRVRQQAAISGSPQSGLRKLKNLLTDWPLALHLTPGLRTAFAATLAVAAMGTIYYQWFAPMSPLQPRFSVEVTEEAPFFLDPKGIQVVVAGRQFVLNDSEDPRRPLWAEKGLKATDATTRVEAGSPVGRALLAKYTDLDVLLEDGGSVVIEDGADTFELVS